MPYVPFVEYIQNSFRTYVTEVVTHRPSLSGRRDAQTKYDAYDLYDVSLGRGSRGLGRLLEMADCGA